MIKIVGTTCQGSIKVAEFLERFEKKKKASGIVPKRTTAQYASHAVQNIIIFIVIIPILVSFLLLLFLL